MSNNENLPLFGDRLSATSVQVAGSVISMIGAIAEYKALGSGRINIAGGALGFIAMLGGNKISAYGAGAAAVINYAERNTFVPSAEPPYDWEQLEPDLSATQD